MATHIRRSLLTVCLALWLPGRGLSADLQIKPHLAVGQETRDFSWAISGANGTPDVRSELTWQNLKAQRVDLGVAAEHPRFESTLQGSFATVESGTVRDSDYLENNRQNEEFRSLSSASGSRFTQWQLLIGPRIGEIGRLEILPQVGYLHINDRYRLHDGRWIVGASGSIDGLDSRYDTRMQGFGGGLTVRYFSKKWADIFQVGWHRYMLDYDASADWNLRINDPDPANRFRYFRHKGTAMEDRIRIDGQWRVSDRLSVFARWEQTVLSLEHGLDTTYYLDPARTENQPLKSVSSRRNSWLIGLKGDF